MSDPEAVAAGCELVDVRVDDRPAGRYDSYPPSIDPHRRGLSLGRP